MAECATCGRPLVRHRRLPLLRCKNGYYGRYDYWIHEQPAARVIPENMDVAPCAAGPSGYLPHGATAGKGDA